MINTTIVSIIWLSLTAISFGVWQQSVWAGVFLAFAMPTFTALLYAIKQ